jgi:hypothetical protein
MSCQSLIVANANYRDLVRFDLDLGSVFGFHLLNKVFHPHRTSAKIGVKFRYLATLSFAVSDIDSFTRRPLKSLKSELKFF